MVHWNLQQNIHIHSGDCWAVSIQHEQVRVFILFFTAGSPGYSLCLYFLSILEGRILLGSPCLLSSSLLAIDSFNGITFTAPLLSIFCHSALLAVLHPGNSSAGSNFKLISSGLLRFAILALIISFMGDQLGSCLAIFSLKSGYPFHH